MMRHLHRDDAKTEYVHLLGVLHAQMSLRQLGSEIGGVPAIVCGPE